MTCLRTLGPLSREVCYIFIATKRSKTLGDLPAIPKAVLEGIYKGFNQHKIPTPDKKKYIIQETVGTTMLRSLEVSSFHTLLPLYHKCLASLSQEELNQIVSDLESNLSNSLALKKLYEKETETLLPAQEKIKEALINAGKVLASDPKIMNDIHRILTQKA